MSSTLASVLLRRAKRRARSFGEPCGLCRAVDVIGWALAHHELHPRLGIALSLCRFVASSLRRFVARSGEQELSVSPSALPKHGHPWPFPRAGCPSHFSLSGHCAAGAARTPKAAPEGRRAGCPESRKVGQRKACSSAPYAHPCAPGTRESVGVRGQAIRGLSRTSAASLRLPLGADPRPPAASQGPLEKRGLLPAKAKAETKAEAQC